MCAGLLMLGSAATWFLAPSLGLYAVALCMGGAAATAAKMPNAMHRPCGLVFSNATLVAAMWVVHMQHSGMPIITRILCGAAYMAGIAGRLLVPTNPLAIKLLGSLSGKEKKEGSKEAMPGAKPKEAMPAEGTVVPSEEAKKTEEKKGPVRKRAATPEPARKTVQAAEAGA